MRKNSNFDLVNKEITMGKKDDRIEKKIGFNGILVMLALIVLYGLSCTAIKSWQIYLDDFMGIIETGLFSLIISAFWLAMYWFLDRLQHESIKMTFLAFILGAMSYLSFYGWTEWFVGSSISHIIFSVGLPVVSFFAVFVLVVMRFESFDELVDSFIYGGFVGTGIAFAVCMSSFVKYESLDGQFLIIELITKISVYAAICSLSGFVVHQTLLHHKTTLIIPVIVSLLFFALYNVIDAAMMRNVATAGIKFLPVLIAICFSAVLTSSVIILIRLTLMQEAKTDSAQTHIAISSVSLITICVLAGSLLIFALCLRYEACRTVTFSSADANVRFRLPVGFFEKQENSGNSIFTIGSMEERTVYKKDNIKIYISSSEQNAPKYSSPYQQYGWNISSKTSQFADKNASGVNMIVYQTSYCLNKGETNLVIDILTDTYIDSQTNRAFRILVKSLEVSHE